MLKVPNRPAITSAQVLEILKKHGVDLKTEKVVLLGIRGLLAKDKNQIGVWDDALCWVTEHDCTAFNGNTDPSREAQGRANLKTGKWHYKMGVHSGAHLPPYDAFRQHGDVTVLRWDEKKKAACIPHTGQFGINIHHGGQGTSSLGCQTIPKEQWDEFKELGYDLLKTSKKPYFTYLLVEKDGSIA